MKTPLRGNWPGCNLWLLHQLRTLGWLKNGQFLPCLFIHPSKMNELRMAGLGPIGRITRVYHVAEIPWWALPRLPEWRASIFILSTCRSALNLLTYSQSKSQSWGYSRVYQHIQYSVDFKIQKTQSCQIWTDHVWSSPNRWNHTKKKNHTDHCMEPLVAFCLCQLNTTCCKSW